MYPMIPPMNMQNMKYIKLPTVEAYGTLAISSFYPYVFGLVDSILSVHQEEFSTL